MIQFLRIKPWPGTLRRQETASDMGFFRWRSRHKTGLTRLLTICSNSPVTVVVGSGQEALGLLVRQDAGTRTEPLEEKSEEKDGLKSAWHRQTIPVTRRIKQVNVIKKADPALQTVLNNDDDSLELFLLDVAAVVIVQDGEDLLDVLGALLGEATHLEELLGAETVCGYTHNQEQLHHTFLRASSHNL